MQTSINFLFFLIFFFLISCVETRKKVNQPNIILIMIDDLGYGDLACYGSENNLTPNIDQLAREGMKFTDFHSNGPMCTPTRAALLTGMYQNRLGQMFEGPLSGKTQYDKGLPLEVNTIAEVLKEGGYVTGMFGKWHLGYQPPFLPADQGFDVFRGLAAGDGDHHSHIDRWGREDWWLNNSKDMENGYSVDLITQHSVEFIKSNKDRPFFLYVPHLAIHFPWQGPNDTAHRERGVTYEDDKWGIIPDRTNVQPHVKAMVESVDAGLGKIVTILKYLKLYENDRMLVVLPFYYCYGLSLLHTHLRVGGSIVLNNSFIFLGTVFNNFLDYQCTGFAGVPSHFQIILRKSDTFKTTRFPHLKYVTQAGGKLAPIFIDEFRDSQPDIRFIVMYGQTEATARLSWLPPELWESKKGSMGKGIPGVELKVVNEKGDLINPGETGEVIAKGDNIMIGYFADEEGTASTLKNGWLHTGDLGTVDEERYIYLTARKKEIIKVGGKRISPKEIEAVILQIPEVVDCSIEGVEDEIQGEALKATVVIKKGSDGTITEDDIKQHCAKHLALFKVPYIYELKDRIMMSATGKKIKNK
jgi:hypothetical protein